MRARKPVPGRSSSGAAFTLLEVMIALALLAGALGVLGGAQATAVEMTQQAEDLVTATMLSRDVMTRVELFLEAKGFGENDITESGDFKSDYDGNFDDFEWTYSVHRVDMDLGNLQGLLDAFGGGDDDVSGADTEQVGAPTTLSDLGIDLSMFDDQIARYIRAVEVTVTWKRGKEPEELTLVTHVVNPTGRVASGDQEEEIGGLPSLSGGSTVTQDDGAGGGTASTGGSVK